MFGKFLELYKSWNPRTLGNPVIPGKPGNPRNPENSGNPGYLKKIKMLDMEKSFEMLDI